MAWTTISRSNRMSLDEVLSQLSQQSAVDGILLLGSAARGTLTAVSDYDLLLVLSTMPVLLHVALTWIDRRLTDVIFTTVAAVEQIVADGDVSAVSDDDRGQLIRWLADGVISFDRHGRLERAQRKVRAVQLHEVRTEGELYARWFRANYNIEQTKRYLLSEDPAYGLAVELRLLYQLADLMVDYFRVRRLPWRGEKEAVRYWAEHDAIYLDTFRQCLAETNRQRKVQQYERLAALTLDPVGPPWPPMATAILPKARIDWQPETIQSALGFWETLIQGRCPPDQGQA